MQLDDQVCLCFHISKRKVMNYLRIHRPRVPSQLADCGGAGTGCGWCIPFLKRYFENAKAENPVEDDLLSAEEYAQQRGDYIHAGKGTPPPGATPPPSSRDEDLNS
ncbi:MAG: (2Fe-2S)-binding protein [Planctomycetaceae bacterium]|nr:(2Fe-2S)-binding protein [Planctomycetaceae bacterium]